MKTILGKMPFINVKHFLMDAGYDFEAIYKLAIDHDTIAVIDYNKRNESQPEGFDKYFRPICKEGNSYVFNSYDPKYKAVKYTLSKRRFMSKDI